MMIEPSHPRISVRRQCELVGLNRATFYRQPGGETPLNLRLMRLIDEEYTRSAILWLSKDDRPLKALGMRSIANGWRG